MAWTSQRASVLKKSITCKELVENSISNVKENSFTNSFIELFQEDAIKNASELDNRIAQGKVGKLAGSLISVKDIIAIKDKSVTAGSQILKGYTSPFSANAIEKLIQEDAIIIGRANCDEFGMGSSNENSSYGPVKNFQDASCVPGGSSGGSAVSVQQGACTSSIGSDTGGSVRQPASFCGLYGLKPTYSAVSRYGLLAYASSFDTIGVLSSDLSECREIFNVISGHDKKDSTSYTYSKSTTLGKEQSQFKPKKIAWISDLVQKDLLHSEVNEGFTHFKEQLAKEGVIIEEVELGLVDYLLPVYYLLTTAEASSNLSRYDGIRYGFRSKDHVEDLMETYKYSRSEGFGDEVKRRIFLGTFALSASYHDAYYTKAQKARRLIRNKTRKILSSYDAIISPTTPGPAFKLGEKTDDPISMYLSDLFTVHASVCGLPALSMPWLHVDKNKMPVGLQITGNDFEEEKIMAIAEYFNSVTP